MNRSPRRPLMLALLFAILMGLPAAAHANPRVDTRQPVAQSVCMADAACRGHYQTGYRASQAGQYAAALAEYQLAYTSYPVPLLLFNIGRTLHRMERHSEAIDYYQKYLDSSNFTTAELREKTLQYKAESEREQAAAEAARTPPPVVVTIEKPAASKPPPPPVYKRWWFWTAIVGGAAAVAVGVGVGVSQTRPKESTIQDGISVFSQSW